jgi:predicted mannosyl-3-phosphoglycerate phosphatase (HAD superfamily)
MSFSPIRLSIYTCVQHNPRLLVRNVSDTAKSLSVGLSATAAALALWREAKEGLEERQQEMKYPNNTIWAGEALKRRS